MDMGIVNRAYEMFCSMRYPMATQQDVADLECGLRIRLPESFKEYLRVFNGGEFTNSSFDRPLIWLDDQPSIPSERLEFMRGVGSQSDRPMGRRDDIDLIEENWEPLQLLPIGETERGSLILLVVIPEDDYGQILLKTFYTTIWLSDDISGFFRRLEPLLDE